MYPSYVRMVTTVLFVAFVAYLTAAQNDWDEDEDADGKFKFHILIAKQN